MPDKFLHRSVLLLIVLQLSNLLMQWRSQAIASPSQPAAQDRNAMTPISAANSACVNQATLAPMNNLAATAMPTTTDTRQKAQAAFRDADALAVVENNFVSSASVVDTALASGKWSANDTVALVPYLQTLNVAQRIALLDKIHAAVNRQELKLEDIPPL